MPLDMATSIFTFTAGVLALLSPCGFPMLPGYISYYFGGKVARLDAIAGGLFCASGLALIFSLIGIFASLLGSLITPYVPLFIVIAGVGVISLGATVLMKVQLMALNFPIRDPAGKGPIGLFLFGVTYGLAASGCTAPIFISILLLALASGGPLDGLVTFLLYAVGMGSPLVIISVLVTEARELTLRRITNLTPFLHKISGVFMIVIGLYLIYYYLTVYFL